MTTDLNWAERLAGHRIVVTGAHGAIGSHLVASAPWTIAASR
jgi:FlaA1/EpsC-like NDP-sugar epimerase